MCREWQVMIWAALAGFALENIKLAIAVARATSKARAEENAKKEIDG